MSGTPAVALLGELAADQGGLVTSRQALLTGVTRQQLARLANAGALERLRHGVYRVAGAPPQDLDDLRAAWLALNPELTAAERLHAAQVDQQPLEVVSHRSAAVLHQLGDLDAPELEFSVPSRRQPRDPHVRLHQRQLATHQWTLVDGLPVTTVLTTAADLAAGHLDGGHLASVVRDAVTRHHTDVAEVARALAPHAHRYDAPMGQGLVLTQRLLDEAGVPASVRDSAALERLSRDMPLAAASATDRQLDRQLAELARHLHPQLPALPAAQMQPLRELLAQVAAVLGASAAPVLNDDVLRHLLSTAAPADTDQQLATARADLSVPAANDPSSPTGHEGRIAASPFTGPAPTNPDEAPR